MTDIHKGKKEKFDPEKEALKILNESNNVLDKLPQIQSETYKRKGTRVCVNMLDGTRRIFFYADSGRFVGWNED